MTCDFACFSTVMLSYQENVRVIMKDFFATELKDLSQSSLRLLDQPANAEPLATGIPAGC